MKRECDCCKGMFEEDNMDLVDGRWLCKECESLMEDENVE